MRITVAVPDDPAAGIHEVRMAIDGVPRAVAAQRDNARQELRAAFARIFDEPNVFVYFWDECQDCDHELAAGRCVNKGCVQAEGR